MVYGLNNRRYIRKKLDLTIGKVRVATMLIKAAALILLVELVFLAHFTYHESTMFHP